MNVFVDFDNVICDFLARYIEYHKLYTGEFVKPSDVRDWDMLKAFPSAPFPYWQDPLFYESAQPINGAIDAISKIRDWGYKTYIVTGMVEPANLAVKVDWLNRHLHWFNHQFHFLAIWDKWLLRDGVIIDDNPDVFEKFKGKKVCFAYEFNRSVKKEVDLWTNDWNKILAFLRPSP